MITRSTFAFAALTVAGMVATSLTSCSSGSSTNGQGNAAGPTANAGSPTAAATPGGPKATATAGSPTATSGGSTAATAAQLGAELAAGAKNVTSAHVDLDFTIASTKVHGSGVEKVSNGRLVAMDLTEGVAGAGNFRLIIVGGKTYAKLPPQANSSGKPYVLVSPNSSNPVVQQLASSANSALSAASINSYNTFVHAAKSIKVEGRQTVNGVSATHYSVIVDVTKMPNTTAFNKQALAASGIKTIPLGLWVDGQGRPVKVTENLHVQGQTLTVVGNIGQYNQPVTIKAPPASQVSTH